MIILYFNLFFFENIIINLINLEQNHHIIINNINYFAIITVIMVA